MVRETTDDPMAIVSYLPFPFDLKQSEIEDCPLLAHGGSARTMFDNLSSFTRRHLVVDGLRVARLQIDVHEQRPPQIATLVVRELAEGGLEIRRSPATDPEAGRRALRHVAAYAEATVEWT